MKLSRYLWITVFFFSLISLGLFLKSYLIHHALSHFSPAPIPVEVITIQATPWKESVSRVAIIDAMQSPHIVAEVGARIKNILVHPGETVVAGQVLAVLESDLIDPLVQKSQNQCQFDTDQYLRQQLLYQENATSLVAFEQAWTNWQKSCADSAQLSAQRSRYLITAPSEGALGDFHWSIGDWIAPGSVFASLNSIETLEVVFGWPLLSQNELTLNQKVTCLFQGQKYTATIRSLSADLNPITQQRVIRAQFEEMPPALLVGMRGKVVIEQNRHDQFAFSIPQSALGVTALGPVVWVYDPLTATVSSCSVIIDSMNHDQILIRSASLKDGDQIVTLGQFKLHNGQGVKVHE